MINKLSYENQKGKIEMLLGGNGPVRVTALSGFGNPEKEYNTVRFAGKGGQKTLGTVDKARVMVISGDISGDRTLSEKMLRVMDFPGLLTIHFKNKIRQIQCSQSDIELGTRRGGYTGFVLKLVGDGVYFTDTAPTEMAVFKRENMLCGEIVFPCVFTAKTTHATVENFGETDSEPAVYIYNYRGATEGEKGGIIVENLTTGQKIKLCSGMEENETIVIDIKNRKVISSVRGNITNMISDDTYLNRFVIVPGKNLLSARHLNEGEEISVVCSYYSNYREAIL